MDRRATLGLIPAVAQNFHQKGVASRTHGIPPHGRHAINQGKLVVFVLARSRAPWNNKA
jgi:hypothetical protein